MEVMLRCAMPDRPGGLAALTAAIAAGGGDIQAVDVVEHEDGRALDDLVVVLSEEAHLRDVLERIAAVKDVEVVHVGPSRGHPGDAVTRMALGLEAVLAGTQAPDAAAVTLVGGLLRAHDVRLTAPADTPPEAPRRLVIPFGERSLVAERTYRFTRTERWRAEAILRACRAAAGAPQSVRSPSSQSG